MNIKIDIFNEITWPQFKQLSEARNLSEQEKIRQYNFYLDQLQAARLQHWQMYQPKGLQGRVIIQEGFLQQENLFYILQENGSKIYI